MTICPNECCLRESVRWGNIFIQKIILPELKCIKLFVGAAKCDKLFMAAPLCDSSVYDHCDLIRIAYGGETVGDHQSGTALAQFVQCLLY